MGTWGAGNFENDSALDYIGEVVDELEVRIEECLADEDRCALDEDGEGVLMPTVEVLSVLYEYCKAPAPKVAVVRRWKERYLAVFDNQIDGLDPVPGYKEERRSVIETTFDKLEGQAVEFWKDIETGDAHQIDSPS